LQFPIVQIITFPLHPEYKFYIKVIPFPFCCCCCCFFF